MLAVAMPSTLGGGPVAIATAVPAQGFADPSDLLPAFREFVRAAVAQVRTTSRPRPLIALPAFGTRNGGGRLSTGQILRALLDESRELAALHEVDIAFVLRDAGAYALMQRLRRESDAASWPWAQIDRHEVDRLAALARSNQLVPFMGAGISVGAGAPTWNQLIERLSDGIQLSPTERIHLLDPERDTLDQAAWLRLRYEREKPGAFAEAIARAVDMPRYGLLPPMLSALGSEQAVTLNYDRLFEIAAADQQSPRRVIPGDDHGAFPRWLLKMHGSVDDPPSIVLTRDDYLGFNTERAALSALVKATLMTRHLLFVGFGLRDDHFYEIVHDVRRAIGGAVPGTVLTLRTDPLATDVWGDQLAFVDFADPDAGDVGDPAGGAIPRAGRRLEIFLDAVLAMASEEYSYLLSPAFASSLSADERDMADLVRRVRASVTGESELASALRRALAPFGE
ncbi:SIR2 family protein [Schumannella sp. 10F1B-5-1]|uniref:SIR2 family NAD-dependent protein deacylase n=1 Tax=Schumannella sp. 10F1B-5-1 TaxID=2590780 RepID=UPI001131E6E4|nr:SIR2 family protein [Schumannella sp. 10F1B-5-1]TPW72891.1 SIR2 family protein [Schumannella sp. 10F1B-5-1]